MVRTIQREANEAVQAMGQAGADVGAAVKLTDQAGVAFRGIAEKSQDSADRMAAVRQAVTSMQQANHELETAVAEAVLITQHNQQAAEAMGQLNQQMVESLDTVGAIVEETTMATEEMARSANDVAQAIENIASVSEENSAAVEEVSASAEEMTAQVEEVTASAQSLAEMAKTLQAAVAQFQLSAVSESKAPRPPAARGNQGQGPAASRQLRVAPPLGGNGRRPANELAR
jgi:methyl-accepting chemotaxis protein